MSVDVQLAPAHVRGVVHLQHHLRQRVRVHVDRRPPQPHPVRVQVQHLVGLHQPALAPRRVPAHQVRRAEAHDPRPAQHRELAGHLCQLPGRLLVVDGSRVAHLPGRLGVRIPELQPAFVAVDLARRQVERLASGEVLVPVRHRPGDAVRTGSIERSSAHVASWSRDAAHLGRRLNIALPTRPPEWAEDPSACRPPGRASCESRTADR